MRANAMDNNPFQVKPTSHAMTDLVGIFVGNCRCSEDPPSCPIPSRFVARYFDFVTWFDPQFENRLDPLITDDVRPSQPQMTARGAANVAQNKGSPADLGRLIDDAT
jgi:hypothetical protein